MVIKLLITTLLTFSSLQATAEGLDLNPALLGCIFSDGECLTHTGIPIIDNLFKTFFGDDPPGSNTMSDERLCYCYGHSNDCYGFSNDSRGLCREAKIDFYKSIKWKTGQWKVVKRNYENYLINEYGEELFKSGDDMETREEQLTKEGNAPYFNCTLKQLHIWLKHRCGHTAAYRTWRNCLNIAPENTIEKNGSGMGVSCWHFYDQD